MAKLVVPPVDGVLQKHLEHVISQKKLCNDQLWAEDILPLLITRLDTIEASVHQAVKTNTDPPNKLAVCDISAVCSKIRTHLLENFSKGAPFTVQRIAELMLRLDASGYLLTTIVLAQKYLSALSRSAVVHAKETDYLGSDEPAQKKRSREDAHQATPEDYDEHDLPSNVRFVSLPWMLTEETKSPSLKKVKMEEEAEAEDVEAAHSEDDEAGEEQHQDDLPERITHLRMGSSERIEDAGLLTRSESFLSDTIDYKNGRLSEEVLF